MGRGCATTNEEKKGYMTIKEVCDYLGISSSTFYRAHARNIPAYIVGKSLKYKKDEVDRSLKKVW